MQRENLEGNGRGAKRERERERQRFYRVKYSRDRESIERVGDSKREKWKRKDGETKTRPLREI